MQVVDHTHDVPGVLRIQRAEHRLHLPHRHQSLHRHHMSHHELHASTVCNEQQQPGESSENYIILSGHLINSQ